MEEKRQTKRVETALEIMTSHGSIIPGSRISNISITGAFIATSNPLPVDDTFTIQLQLPGVDVIMTIAVRVVWTKIHTTATRAGMGIEFTNILPEHQKKLAAFIEQNSPQNSSRDQAAV
jgi:Tfp pilus assembly protein PilZ